MVIKQNTRKKKREVSLNAHSAHVQAPRQTANDLKGKMWHNIGKLV